MRILKKDFYNRDTLLIARELLGKVLVRQMDGLRLSGRIVETEAYCGQTDSACHAHRGQTQRNAVMFGPPGHAYVYFTYGMHYLLNLVTEPEGEPCAVLIRAIAPIDGIDTMRARRKRPDRELANGPAKLCQALALDKSVNGLDVTCGRVLWVEEPSTLAIPARIAATPRIGIGYAKAEHRDALWRFTLED